jgi:hypothetical protein
MEKCIRIGSQEFRIAQITFGASKRMALVIATTLSLKVPDHRFRRNLLEAITEGNW